MPSPYLADITDRFPLTVLEEAQQKQADDLPLVARFRALGAATIIGGGVSRDLRTATVARTLRTTESTLFRHVPKPLLDQLEQQGVHALTTEFFRPRLQALTEAAVRLTLDRAIGFTAAVEQWSDAYGLIGTPANVYDAAASLRPHEGAKIIHEHAVHFAQNIALLGMRDNVFVPEYLGMVTLPALAAYDTSNRPELGQATNAFIHCMLNASPQAV